ALTSAELRLRLRSGDAPSVTRPLAAGSPRAGTQICYRSSGLPGPRARCAVPRSKHTRGAEACASVAGNEEVRGDPGDPSPDWRNAGVVQAGTLRANRPRSVFPR